MRSKTKTQPTTRPVRRLVGLAGATVLMAVVAVLLAPSAAAADATSIAALGPSGDPDGSGVATVTVSDDGMVCFEITVADIADPAAAHIHVGAAGATGGVVVDFDVAANGTTGCVMTTPETVAAIVADPEGHYVNVHNAEFPAGAIRGQLNTFIMPVEPGPEPIDGEADEDAAAALINRFADGAAADDVASASAPAAVPAASTTDSAAPAATDTPTQLAFTGSETSIAIAGLALIGSGLWLTVLGRRMAGQNEEL